MRKRHFSKEFKLEAIAMAEERENLAEVARELGLRYYMLRRWKKEYEEKKNEAFQGNGQTNKPKNRQLTEMQRLKKELKEVTLERDILKKAVHIFSKSDSNQNSDL